MKGFSVILVTALFATATFAADISNSPKLGCMSCHWGDAIQNGKSSQKNKPAQQAKAKTKIPQSTMV